MSSRTTVFPAELSSTMDRNWGAVAASTVGLTFSLGTLLLYTFGVFVGPLNAEFGWTRTQLAFALAISQYTFAFAAPGWGLLIDRFGPRRIVLPSAVGLSLLVASLALLTPHIWHYYLVFAAVTFCAGGASPLGYAAVLVRKFERHLGLALGLALMGVGLGAAILPPLAQALTGAAGWRGAYAGLGVLTFVCTVPAALLATKGVGQPGRLRPGMVRASVLPFVRTRAFILMCIIFLLLGTVSIGALASLVPMMISRGFSPPAAAQLAGLTGLVAIAGRGGIGLILDCFHAPHVVAGVALLALIAFLLLAFSQATGSAYAIAALLGAVIGAEVDFTAFFVRRYFGNVMFGQLYGLVFGIFLLGSGTGPVVASASFDWFGSYQPGAMLFAAASIVIVALTFALPAYGRPGAAMVPPGD